MSSHGRVVLRRESRPAASTPLHEARWNDSFASCRYTSSELLMSESDSRKVRKSCGSMVNSRSARKFKRLSPSISSCLGTVAPSKRKALSCYPAKQSHDRWVFTLRRPRTSWGKPHASFRKLVSIFKEGKANHPLVNFISVAERESHEREVVVFVPSFLSGGHSNSWSIPSSASSSQEPFSTQLHSMSQSSSEGTIAVCSPSSCSEEDFCSSDAMSFVMQDDCYESVLNFMPCSSNEAIMSSPESTYILYAGDEIRRSEREVEASTEITSAEEYRIDLSDFEPEENAVEANEEKSKRGLCLSLDYEDVLRAWSDRGCLWADGKRPMASCFLTGLA